LIDTTTYAQLGFLMATIAIKNANNLSSMERQEQMLRFIQEHKRATVDELIAHFGVSAATVRRDLDTLEKQGKVKRFRGGAMLGQAPPELPALQRAQEQSEEKARIGKEAAQLVENGDTIFLGSGTTVLEVAKNLHERKNLTVITNSLLVVNELAHDEAIDTVVIGGMLRHSELSMIGHIAEQALAEVRASKVFMGIRAIDLKNGLTNDYLPETLTDRAILNIGAQTVILADHTKCGVISTAFLAPLSAVDVLITDDKTDKHFIDAISELDITVRVA
jgi:DeoR/GlpR family transcriptional regulator of sugar metabolism